MKIRIEIDVPKYINGTECRDCPFEKYSKLCFEGMKYCKNVDFSRIEITNKEIIKC